MLVSSMGRRFGSFKADPARTTCSGRLCEVCDLFLFGEREDDLCVHLGCSFQAICLGGSGDGFVGKKIRGRWCCWRCLLFSGEVAANVPQWTTMGQGECSVALAYAA